jgi:hypothetical protein
LRRCVASPIVLSGTACSAMPGIMSRRAGAEREHHVVVRKRRRPASVSHAMVRAAKSIR